MSQKFRNKYRSESTRLKGRDYSAPGKYFITINTCNREPFFGNISENKIILSNIGLITQTYYLEIPKHFKNVKLDEYVIMPDHIHGIIEIMDNDSILGDIIVVDDCGGNVDTPHGAYLQPNPQTQSQYHKPQWKPGTLGVIINQFRSSVTRFANKNYPALNFQWQALFHDRIIRMDEYERIKSYIRNNIINSKAISKK